MTASRRAARAEYFEHIVYGTFRARMDSALLKGTLTRCGLGYAMSGVMLEGVRSVGAHGELELEDEFVGGAAFAILRCGAAARGSG